MGATALTNGVNGLSISTSDIQFGDSSAQYTYTNGFSNTPSSIRSNSPSQMSSSTIGTAQPEPQQLPTLEQHLAENGLRSPRFPDTSIHLANFPPISGHALFLCRSPYINALLLNQPPSPPYTINLPVSDPNLTYDALLTTLQYLYSSSTVPSTSPDPSSIISHIAACCAFGIFPASLVDSYRSILLKANLTPQTVIPFVQFLLSAPHTLEPPSSHPGPYPPFTTGLLSNVIQYFLTDLPIHLQSSSPAALPATANTEDYKAMLVPLPFDLLKSILEHPLLPIGSEKQRYELAKSIVSKRAARDKHVRKRTNSGTPPVEESVILKVGGKDGEGVQLVKSFNRRRVLWKASSGDPQPRSRNSTAGSK